MVLTYKQTLALDILENTTTTELVYGGSAGGGKSYLGVLWCILSALKYDGTRWLIGRSKLKELKSTTLKSFFDVCKIQGLKRNQHYRYNEQSGTITFQNDSEIILKDLFSYPSDPNFDSLGGLEITGAFVDECNAVAKKAWQIVKSRIRYKLNDYGLIPKLLGTCNPSKNWVYNDFYKPYTDDNLEPHRAFLQALPTDNPHLPASYITDLHNLDNASKQRLLFGNWDYDVTDNDLLTYDQILDLFTNNHVEGDPTKKAITTDIAMEGSDLLIIIFWNSFIAEQIKVIPKSNGKEVIDAIQQMANKYGVPKSRIVYDCNGVGNFVGGFLQGAKPFNNGAKALNNENYKNLKTQCIYKFCERVKQGGYYVKDSLHKEKIITELSQLKRAKIDSDGKLEVVGKDEIKKIIGHSPDFSDSLIMREFLELKPKGFFV